MKPKYPDNLLNDIAMKNPQSWSAADRQRLRAVINLKFDWRTQEIIRARYKSGMSYRQIGKEFRLSSSRVREILKNALVKLQHPTIRNVWCLGVSSASEQMLVRDASQITADMPLWMLPVSIATYDRLYENGVTSVREVEDYLLGKRVDRELFVGIGRVRRKELAEALNCLKDSGPQTMDSYKAM